MGSRFLSVARGWKVAEFEGRDKCILLSKQRGVKTWWLLYLGQRPAQKLGFTSFRPIRLDPFKAQLSGLRSVRRSGRRRPAGL